MVEPPGGAAAPLRGRAQPYLFSLPLLVVIGFLLLYPVLRIVVLTFVESLEAGGVRLTLGRYVEFFADPFNLLIFWRTVKLSLATTLVTLVAAYPVALAMRELSPRWRAYLSLVLLSPLLMSAVVRTLGWVILLAPRGVVNGLMASLGLAPLRLIYNELGVVLGLSHVYFGYMVLSLMTSILKIDANLLAAAANLGAGRWHIFRHVIWPLSLPGVLAGSILVFTLSASAYVTPALLGGTTTQLMGPRVYDLAIVQLDFGAAAVYATILFCTIFIIVYTLIRTVESGKRRVIFE